MQKAKFLYDQYFSWIGANIDFNAATMLSHTHDKRLRQNFDVGAISF